MKGLPVAVSDVKATVPRSTSIISRYCDGYAATDGAVISKYIDVSVFFVEVVYKNLDRENEVGLGIKLNRVSL